MSEMITVGDAIARTLEQYQVEAIYGVISIHNLPIADAVGQRGNIRFVPARGEAGSVTMADAHGRFSGLGVALTSTGAGAGNAVGALVEAMNACTPLLHLTGQVEKAWLDADTGFIHETRDQLTFLKASSKRAYRISNANQAIAILHKAIQDAQTPPCGPVSVEIPIDIQGAKIPLSLVTAPVKPASVPAVDTGMVDALWAQLKQAKQPLLWLGGGALGSAEAVKKLADAGITVISSTHARGVLPDDHRASLRAFHNSPSVEALIAQCDFTLVAGSRLRSNETRSWTLELPSPRVQIDIDPAAASRNYLMDSTLIADCSALLGALAKKVQGREWGNAQWDMQVQQAVGQAEQGLREQCGAYAKLNDAIEKALPKDGQLFHAQGRGLHVGLRGKAGCIILGAPQSAHPGIDPHRRGAHMQHPGGKACLFAVYSPHNALHQPNQADQNGRRGSQLTKAEGQRLHQRRNKPLGRHGNILHPPLHGRGTAACGPEHPQRHHPAAQQGQPGFVGAAKRTHGG